MRTYEEIDRIMQTFPERHRRFCTTPAGEECGCTGCVGLPGLYTRIDMDPREQITREEFDRWKSRQPPTEAELNSEAFARDRAYLERFYGGCAVAYKNGFRQATGLDLQAVMRLVKDRLPVAIFVVGGPKV